MKKLLLFAIILSFPLAALFADTDSKASEPAVDFLKEAEKRGMTVYFDPLAENGIIEKNSHFISFRAEDSIILNDCKFMFKTDAPVLKSGKLLVTQKFIDDIEKYFKSDENEALFKIGAVLIDPGHGGKDPGALATHTVNGKKIEVKEKDVNLQVGKLLYKKLKANYPDKKILMTRDTDVFISLSQRTEIANSVQLKDNEAILYVSIHVNASLDKNANGYEVWYLSPGYRRQVVDKSMVEDENLLPILNSMMEEEYTTESILIAKFVMEGIASQIGNKSPSRGIKAEEWFVVRNANMPSVLVELGFLTNKTEAVLLADDGYLQKLALGIYNGLSAFIVHFERSRGFTGIK